MSATNFELLRARLEASSGKDIKLNREFLKYVREHHIRESTLVSIYGAPLVDKYASSLGDELWVVLEQVCIAALDSQDLKLADMCISKLDAKFPNSSRVRRLQALRMEAAVRYDDADLVYQRMLLDDPTNTFAMKRRITIARERRDLTRAVQLLNEYLTVFMSDTEAWLELADLYIQQGMYSNASFCFEELLLASPQNCHLYVKYAELRFTMGGVENLELAKKYYSFALELNPDKNTNRAWFGLLATTHALALLADPSSGASKKASSAASESKYVAEMNKLARTQLTKNYENSSATTTLKECLPKTLSDFTVDRMPDSGSSSSKDAKTR
eukprot:TRINITY_DN8765_c0_g1_i1.p1 TRINITY_DN8765_c0_g1~~TRINITY_DN8765_c0_g1_i1.p1  ORF type:complete len:329 (-),score=68.69 TRINITY_DN8765_c0_g1_i1:115-1101(-)